MISSPADLEPLDVEGEWQRLQQALAPRIEAGLVVLDRLPEASVTALGVWLRQHETHVIHMVGHGDFSQSPARACFISRTGTGGALRSPPRCSARSCAITTRCGWWCSMPADPRAPMPWTRSAEWRRGSCSRTRPPFSRCSSRSPTAPPCRSPAPSTERWSTDSLWTRRPAVRERRFSPTTVTNGRPPSSSCGHPTATSSRTFTRCLTPASPPQRS